MAEKSEVRLGDFKVIRNKALKNFVRLSFYVN